MKQVWFTRLRAGIGIWAVLIALSGAWIVIAEVLSPALPYFPISSGQAAMFAASQNSAAVAATIGLVRGDLWTAAALTEAAPLLVASAGRRPAAALGAAIERARSIAERAAELAPHDSRNWLLLAGLEAGSAKAGGSASEALKLSYYTDPNEFALTPLRLMVAAGMNWDDDLQGLVQLEIERVILQRPDLKPAIAAAYKFALPETRQMIETTLKQTDPALLASLTAAPRQ